MLNQAPSGRATPYKKNRGIPQAVDSGHDKTRWSISRPDNQIRGSQGAIEGETGYALLEGRKIGQGVIDTEESSHP
jgi:hypothetical protein